MTALTFDEFTKNLEGCDERALREHAKSQGLNLPQKLAREIILRKLFESLDIPKATPAQLQPENPPVKSTPKDTAHEPGVVYKVFLRATKPRMRGGRRWDLGMTEVPIEEMTEALRDALNGDGSFTVFKVEA